MKKYEECKAKRLALGVTQAELAKYVGVSAATISRFESGEFMSPEVYRAITRKLEEYIRAFDPETYYWLRIKQAALSLENQTDAEKLMNLSHMCTHIGKLLMSIQNRLADDSQ